MYNIKMLQLISYKLMALDVILGKISYDLKQI